MQSKFNEDFKRDLEIRFNDPGYIAGMWINTYLVCAIIFKP